MKNIFTLNRSCFALLFILFWIYGCAPSLTPMAGFDPDDESGIGGTGMLAQKNGSGTTAIIGAITGFGSIFINGVEIDIPSQTAIYENGKAVPQPHFAIGDVLEVLAVPGENMHEARRIHIRHEVSGPVTQVSQEARSFMIMKQLIFMGTLSEPIPNVGEHIQVSGFRDNDQRIHASRITTSSASTVSLSGNVSHLHGNTLLIGEMLVIADHLPPLEIGSQINVEGDLQDDKLLAHTVNLRSSALPFAGQTNHWLVQGFLTQQAAGQFSIADITVPADNAKLHELLGHQNNILVQVDIATSPTAASSPTVMSILDGRTLPTGRLTPPPVRPLRPLIHNGSGKQSTLPSPMNRHPSGVMRR